MFKLNNLKLFYNLFGFRKNPFLFDIMKKIEQKKKYFEKSRHQMCRNYGQNIQNKKIFLNKIKRNNHKLPFPFPSIILHICYISTINNNNKKLIK